VPRGWGDASVVGPAAVGPATVGPATVGPAVRAVVAGSGVRGRATVSLSSCRITLIQKADQCVDQPRSLGPWYARSLEHRDRPIDPPLGRQGVGGELGGFGAGTVASLETGPRAADRRHVATVCVRAVAPVPPRHAPSTGTDRAEVDDPAAAHRGRERQGHADQDRSYG
jgi:hypothetical protein